MKIFGYLLVVVTASLWIVTSKTNIYYKAKRYLYRQVVPAKNPRGAKETLAIYEKEGATPVDFVFLGDSMIYNCDFSGEFAQDQYKNRGINGDTVDSVSQRLEESLRFSPKAIFLMIGENDLERGEKVSIVAEKIGNLVLKVRRESGDTLSSKPNPPQIYLQSVLPANESQYSYGRLDNQKVFSLNRRLKTRAQELGVVFVDLEPVLVKDEELDAQYTWDGVHLNSLGCKTFATFLKKSLLPDHKID